MNTNDNAANSASQTKQILAWMNAGNSINPLQALGLFGCFRLGARIADIERLIGYPPKRERIKVTNHSGKEVWVMKYYL